MNHQSHTDGARAAGRPGPDGPMPQWPVLARLPRVGQPEPEHVAPLPTFAPPEQLATSTKAQAEARRDGSSRHVYIDEPHQAMRPFDWPAATEATLAREAAVRDLATPRMQHRIDHGVRRVPSDVCAPAAAGCELPGERPTLAGRVYQLHASLAPHAGVALTFALVVSAAALWWLTIGQSTAPTNYDNALDRPGAWPHSDAGDASSLGGPAGEVTPARGYTLPFNCQAAPAGDSQAPRPESSPYLASTPCGCETTGGGAACCDKATPVAESNSQAMAPAPSPASVVTIAGESQTAPENVPEPVGPSTPTPLYPTTPFASFASSQAPNAASSPSAGDTRQPAVAQRTGNDTTSSAPR